MTVPEFGEIELLNPREYWRSESADFTPWLAEPDNIRRLGVELGIELEVVATEHEVGPFSADIVCAVAGSDYRVVIENQLERTDHDHLGKLLTYAAGIENTQAIVWIAPRFTDEHRAALDWLNGVTSDLIRFFGAELQVWRIGSSVPALKFELVAKPNEWSKTVRSAPTTQVQSERKQIQLQFWTAFREHLAQQGSPIRTNTPRSDSWTTIALGRGGAVLSPVASNWDLATQRQAPGVNRVELVLEGQYAVAHFQQLLARKEEIEAQLGESAVWYEPNTERTRKVFVQQHVPPQAETEAWLEQFRWLQSKLERFDKVFRPLVRQLNNTGPEDEPDPTSSP